MSEDPSAFSSPAAALTSAAVPPWVWLVFSVVVLVSITVDLLAHRGDRVDSRKRALLWSAAWIGLALLFNLGVWAVLGAQAAEELIGCYLLEKSLSIDNLFVFVLLFGELGIPRAQQRRVLTWGIFGALATRGLCIAVGVAALERWHGLVYALGGLLIVTAIKMLATGEAPDPSQGRVLRFLRRILPLSTDLDGGRFLVRRAGRLLGTPLLLALLAVELTDVVFAIDSVPAAFAVTDSPFIIYSANVFALLGLRSLYIVLADALVQLRYLRVGLAAVLGLAGVKMIISRWVHVPPLIAVAAIAVCIGGAVLASLWRRRRDRVRPGGAGAPVGGRVARDVPA
jgi:tellurite resistance protein TerC